MYKCSDHTLRYLLDEGSPVSAWIDLFKEIQELTYKPVGPVDSINRLYYEDGQLVIVMEAV